METDEFEECVECGARVDVASSRACALSDEYFLCWECALRRGGVYDAATERWVEAPSTQGLPDERRPHP